MWKNPRFIKKLDFFASFFTQIQKCSLAKCKTPVFGFFAVNLFKNPKSDKIKNQMNYKTNKPDYILNCNLACLFLCSLFTCRPYAPFDTP